MPTDLTAHLLLLAAVLCAASLVKLLRGVDGIGRGYAFVVGGLLVSAVMVMGAGVFAEVVILGLIVATVVVPWLLEQGARAAFARGRMVWVARLSSLRASLMPGAGLERQLPILEGLALLESDGVDVALQHLRRLADDAEDNAELAVIHEQIVAMLFYGQRWDEGIAHYERRFAPGYAALRPSLALGLLRAYGESGRLENAAGLLRELENGPVSADANGTRVLSQARLTFLAYAGAIGPVEELARTRRFSDLGMSPATFEFFRAVAQTRAGEPQQAVETLRKVEALAGPRDHRVLVAARALIERVRELLRVGEAEILHELWTTDSGPEVLSYVDVVAQRMRELVLELPTGRRRARSWMTYVVIASLGMVYGLHLLRGGGGMGLLELGALSEDLWLAQGATPSGLARVVTASWIHVDLVGLLFDAYAIWLAGQIVERLLGPARMALVTVAAAIAGMAASVLALPWLWSRGLDSLAVVGPTGGSLMAVGAITAALWCLLPSRTPALTIRGRRNLVVTLSLLLVANLLLSWPGIMGFGVAPAAVLVCVLAASLVTALPVILPRWVERGLGGLVALLVILDLAAVVAVMPASGAPSPRAFLVEHRAQECELGEQDGETVQLHTPIHISLSPLASLLDPGTGEGSPAEFQALGDGLFPVPLLPGLIDGLELRDGGLVQFAGRRVSGEEAASGELALFSLAPGFEHGVTVSAAGSLPEPFAALVAAEPQVWRVADLWQNGERVGRVIEHRLMAAEAEAEVEGDEAVTTVLLLASPAEAIEHAPELYAAILQDAALVPAGADTGEGAAHGPRRARCTVK
ncbi:MAG: rhomboid family intramembrane serine protease [Myxococcales bacterium]|nr:rhomboid family intramembrane serine protease [Myxococcales bacterium]